jgi:hypothetical protein
VNVVAATPASPAQITATYGDSFSGIAGSLGSAFGVAWQWDFASSGMSGLSGASLLGNASPSAYSYRAKYVSADATNVNSLSDVEVLVLVQQAEPALPAERIATYGNTLSSVQLPADWSWGSTSHSYPTTQMVGMATEAAVTQPGQPANPPLPGAVFYASYNPTGTDASNYLAKNDVPVGVHVLRRNPTPPTGLIATYGNSLADVSLGSWPGWSWHAAQPANVLVGDVGGSPHSHGANFSAALAALASGGSGLDEFGNPWSDNNWNQPENVALSIAVGKATPTSPAAQSAIYGDTLASVTLPAGWTWTSTSAATDGVGTVGNNTFAAAYSDALLPSAAQGNYNDVAEQNVLVTVAARDIGLAAVPLGAAAWVQVGGQQLYTGNPVLPPAGDIAVSMALPVTVAGATLPPMPSPEDLPRFVLNHGSDYSYVLSSGGTNVGAAQITVSGTGNFTGSVTGTYNILPAELTGFAPILDIASGWETSHRWESSSEVESWLLANLPEVTAQWAGGSFTVPVSAWQGDGSFNAAVAGSYAFTAVLAADVLGANFVNGADGGSGFTASVNVVVAPDRPLSIANLSGIVAPAFNGIPVAGIASCSEYTGTVSWQPAMSDGTDGAMAGNFAASVAYTATVTIVPEPGYTLAGVPANFFKVAGATAVENLATAVDGLPLNSGVVVAQFAATGDGVTPENVYAVDQAFGTYTGTGSVTARILASDSKFVELRYGSVDGTVVATGNYSHWEGSTFIQLNRAYIASLAAGTHRYYAIFSDGVSEVIVLVINGSGGEDPGKDDPVDPYDPDSPGGKGGNTDDPTTGTGGGSTATGGLGAGTGSGTDSLPNTGDSTTRWFLLELALIAAANAALICAFSLRKRRLNANVILIGKKPLRVQTVISKPAA